MELKTPIRIYWDVTPLPAAPPPWERACAEIVALRVLHVTLRDKSPELAPVTWAILERFRGAPLALVLEAPAPARATAVRERLAAIGVRQLLVPVRGPGEVAALPLDGPLPVGVSWEATRENWRALPELLSACVDRGIANVSLPMSRLVGAASVFSLSAAEQVELAGLLAATPVLDRLRLTIHDPFLWRLVYPQTPFPEGGCQAANTMLYLAPDGTVYPCPALPELLGSLATTPLAELLATPAKGELRRLLRTPPAVCAPCPEAATCLGGCRGRGLVSAGSLAAADPGCGRLPEVV